MLVKYFFNINKKFMKTKVYVKKTLENILFGIWQLKNQLFIITVIMLRSKNKSETMIEQSANNQKFLLIKKYAFLLERSNVKIGKGLFFFNSSDLCI